MAFCIYKVDTIKKRFGIKSCTLVFDRGMVSADNLALIERKDLSYISALDKDEIKSAGIFRRYYLLHHQP